MWRPAHTAPHHSWSLSRDSIRTPGMLTDPSARLWAILCAAPGFRTRAAATGTRSSLSAPTRPRGHNHGGIDACMCCVVFARFVRYRAYTAVSRSLIVWWRGPHELETRSIFRCGVTVYQYISEDLFRRRTTSAHSPYPAHTTRGRRAGRRLEGDARTPRAWSRFVKSNLIYPLSMQYSREKTSVRLYGIILRHPQCLSTT